MRIIRNTVFFSMGLFFTLLALMGAGAIAEEHYLAVTKMLSLLLGHTLFVIVWYLAFHFTPAVVVKFTLANGCIAALSWDEIKNPGKLEELFSFKKHNIYFHDKKSFATTLKLIPICNQSVSLEDKVRFLINPIRLFMELLTFIEQVTIYFVNSIPQKINDESASQYNYNASYAIYRWVKGAVSMVCELIIIPLRFIEPVGNIFYKALYFFIVTLPDYFASLTKVNNRHNLLEQGHTVRHGLPIIRHRCDCYSTDDINKKLAEEE